MRARTPRRSRVALAWSMISVRDPLDVVLADDRDEMPFVDGAENGAAQLGDAGRLDRVEHHVVARWQQPFEAVPETDDIPAELVRGSGDAVNDRVQAGAVAPAVQDTNSHGWDGGRDGME